MSAFIKYFRYRIGSSKRTLSSNIDFMFSEPIDSDWGVDNPNLMSSVSEMRINLRYLGADSGFDISAAENKFKILPAGAFDEEKDNK